jgi:hypothetical protein
MPVGARLPSDRYSARYRMGRNGLRRIDASPDEGRAPRSACLTKRVDGLFFPWTEDAVARTVVPVCVRGLDDAAVIMRCHSAQGMTTGLEVVATGGNNGEQPR